jgi:hypothetical protein
VSGGVGGSLDSRLCHVVVVVVVMVGVSGDKPFISSNSACGEHGDGVIDMASSVSALLSRV